MVLSGVYLAGLVRRMVRSAYGGVYAWMQGMMQRVRAFTRLMRTRHTQDGGVGAFWEQIPFPFDAPMRSVWLRTHGVRVVSPPLPLFLPKSNTISY
jgi:hypothetical protein